MWCRDTCRLSKVVNVASFDLVILREHQRRSVGIAKDDDILLKKRTPYVISRNDRQSVTKSGRTDRPDHRVPYRA